MASTTSTESSQEPIHVCVIGAGVCGIVAIKACLEGGLRVTCFERSSQYGGLWCYRPTVVDTKQDFEPSVMRTTILNTSKELSAFSDYPPPPNLPNYMRHNLYMDYIKSYVDHFQLLPHIRFEHQIISCQPEWVRTTNDDEKKTEYKIKWSVKVCDLKTGQEFVEQFDRLMVAIGHHNIPYVPKLNGQHNFKGQIVHSAQVKDILTDPRFVDKRVLVVGIGNSACDAANDLALVTSKCYVSCHRGNWFISRLSKRGLYDFAMKNRWYTQLSKITPTRIIDKFFIDQLEERTNHKMLGLKPKHRPSEQVPAINDLFPYRVMTGGVCLKGSVSMFTERGVIFEGEEDEYELDVVVLATGYEVRIPFLNEQQLGLRAPKPHADEYNLYLNMFAPQLNNCLPRDITDSSSQLDIDKLRMEAIQSLAFIGFIQPSASITVVSELQSRYAVQLFKDQLGLPNVKKMMRHINRIRRDHSKAIRSHSKDQIVGNWIGYLDLIANQLGTKPNFSKMFFTDFALWRQLIFGPSVPYQYRLVGPNRWLKAREVILATNNRVYQGINDGKNDVLFGCRRKCLIENKTAKTFVNNRSLKKSLKKTTA